MNSIWLQIVRMMMHKIWILRLATKRKRWFVMFSLVIEYQTNVDSQCDFWSLKIFRNILYKFDVKLYLNFLNILFRNNTQLSNCISNVKRASLNMYYSFFISEMLIPKDYTYLLIREKHMMENKLYTFENQRVLLIKCVFSNYLKKNLKQ